VKLLLTSAGIKNTSIHGALVDLLGKPIAESSALFIPTAIYPFPGGAGMAWQLPSIETVYAGVSAGSIAATSTFGETYVHPPRGSGEALTSEDIVFATPQGEISRTLVTARGAGLVDFALIPHLDHEDHPDASLANAENGPGGYQCRRTPLTMRPPSK
jgi:hypothetical protein